MGKIIFIAGTDTGVGKTLLTALLLIHARARGRNALAIKPFCSGGREDVEILQKAQNHAISDEMVNPWYFDAPVAPWVSLREKRENINKHAVLAHLHAVQKKTDLLLVEGAGGLLSPLAKNLDAREIIAALDCPVLLVARNRLGCLNHVFLSLEALEKNGARPVKVVLMGDRRPDLSARTNAEILRKKAGFIDVFAIPWLGARASGLGALKKNEKKIKKTLARLFEFAYIPRRSLPNRRKTGGKKK